MIDFILTDIIAYSLWESTEVVAMVVFLANTVSIWLPNKSNNKFFQAVLTLFNRLSLNILRNANRHYHDLRGEQAQEAEYLAGSRGDRPASRVKPSSRAGKSGKPDRDYGPEQS